MEGIDGALVAPALVVCHVVHKLGVERLGADRRVGVAEGIKRFVVHKKHFGGVHRRDPGRGRDQGYGLAGDAYRPLSKRGAIRHPVVWVCLRGNEEIRNVRRQQHQLNPGSIANVVCFDIKDGGVSERAADDLDKEHAFIGQIVKIPAFASDEGIVLDAANCRSN